MAAKKNNTTAQGGSTSNTVTSTQSGSSSTTTGKSYASGKVDDYTAAQRAKYNAGYQEGQKVTDAYNKLNEVINNKPTFQSNYEDHLNNLYGQIMNRDKFSYDFNADSMYQLYKDQYQNQGKAAMQDTMGQAAALTGGYGSSYAQSAGQQTYQNYLQQLNNMIPELRNQAYQQYKDEGAQLMDKYNLTDNAYNREYGQYRDTMSDWKDDRSFGYGMYTDERNFDYNKFNNDRNYWNNEYWNQRNAETTNYQTTDSTSWQNTNSNTTSSSWNNSVGSQDDSYGYEETGNDYNFGPFNVKKGDYLFDAPKQKVDALIGEFQKAKTTTELIELKAELKHIFGMNDASIGWLESMAKGNIW